MKDDSMIGLGFDSVLFFFFFFFFPTGDAITNNTAKEGCSEIVMVINSKAALFVSRR